MPHSSIPFQILHSRCNACNKTFYEIDGYEFADCPYCGNNLSYFGAVEDLELEDYWLIVDFETGIPHICNEKRKEVNINKKEGNK